MKKQVIILILIVGLILSAGILSADFDIGNLSHSIDMQYGPESNIKGWINISLIDEPADSPFTDSFENSITLIDLLESNIGLEYDCTTADCSSDYSVSNPQTEMSFNLEAGESKSFGFKFSDNLVSIDSVNFTIQSNANSSCENQLKIDFLSDGIIDKGNTKSSGICDSRKYYGCFNESENELRDYYVESVPYCQRIKLSESPGFKLGAWVKKGASSENLTMELYDLSGNSVAGANCELVILSLSDDGEVSCEIDYLVTESEDYYVCISDNKDADHKIKGYSSSEACGFQGKPFKSEVAAYRIFAQGKRFAPIGVLNITNDLSDGNTLNAEIRRYIIGKYGSLNCKSGCVVPVTFYSAMTQEIIIKDLKIEYHEEAGPTTEVKFYDITENPSEITAGFQKIFFDDVNFTVSEDYGELIFHMDLDDLRIFSKEIIIEQVPVIAFLTPMSTASAFPTEFSVVVDSFGNITKYEWDFGDNKTETTTTNKVTHIYGSTGIYKLKVTAIDNVQRSSYKIFEIDVETPEEVIETIMQKMQIDLENVNAQIKEFPDFYQESLNSVLDIPNLESSLKKFQQRFVSAGSSEEEHNDIMTGLLSLKIPESIATSVSADSVLFYPDESNINLDVLSDVGGGSYDISDEDEYIDAIFSWNQENMETKVTFEEISAIYPNGGSTEKPILRVFKLKIQEKNDLNYDSYLIIKEMDDLEFKENYLQSKESGYIYIDLKDRQKTVIFSTTENVYFADLPIFISPKISRLSIIETEIDGEDDEISKQTIFSLIVLLLVIMGIVVYIFLQIWYKRKYEDYLFKNRNHLYNMITYINNAKKQNLSEKVIKNNFKKAGWNSEQISYVVKKYFGKRTGMFELPVSKIMNLFNKKKKVQDQQRPRFTPNTKRFNFRQGRRGF